MKAVEIEVEKIRAVRRIIAEQFDFDPARLGDYYRRRLKSQESLRPKASSQLAARVKETSEE